MRDANRPTEQEDRQPIVNIVGEKVALGPLRRGLVTLYHKWHDDFEVMRFAGTMRPTSLEAEEDRYARVSKAENHADFTIFAKPWLAPIGTTGLNYIDYDNRTAEFGIMIGDKGSWDKGYGTEVTRLMLDYGFNCLGLHNINLWVNAANERGISAYRRAACKRVRVSVAKPTTTS